MIVVNLQNEVIGIGHTVTVENGMLKVDTDNGSFYLGNVDALEYQILDLEVPDTTIAWNYVDGQFIERPKPQVDGLYELLQKINNN